MPLCTNNTSAKLALLYPCINLTIFNPWTERLSVGPNPGFWYKSSSLKKNTTVVPLPFKIIKRNLNNFSQKYKNFHLCWTLSLQNNQKKSKQFSKKYKNFHLCKKYHRCTLPLQGPGSGTRLQKSGLRKMIILKMVTMVGRGWWWWWRRPCWMWLLGGSTSTI